MTENCSCGAPAGSYCSKQDCESPTLARRLAPDAPPAGSFLDAIAAVTAGPSRDENHVIYKRGRGYYRDNRAGYTDVLDQAGRYTALEAARDAAADLNVMALPITAARAMRFSPEIHLPPADPLEFRIARLSLAPGDVLVVKIPFDHPSVHDIERINAVLNKVLPAGARHLLMTADMDLSVLTRAEIEERAK